MELSSDLPGTPLTLAFHLLSPDGSLKQKEKNKGLCYSSQKAEKTDSQGSPALEEQCQRRHSGNLPEEPKSKPPAGEEKGGAYGGRGPPVEGPSVKPPAPDQSVWLFSALLVLGEEVCMRIDCSSSISWKAVQRHTTWHQLFHQCQPFLSVHQCQVLCPAIPQALSSVAVVDKRGPRRSRCSEQRGIDEYKVDSRRPCPGL
ncbi:unnamed protein product [Arctogadus glacialis]